MSNPKTYEQAIKTASNSIWPGCEDGRTRWCGRIHDFSRTLSNGRLIHDFRCVMNHYEGCPQPLPGWGQTKEEWDEMKKEQS